MQKSQISTSNLLTTCDVLMDWLISCSAVLSGYNVSLVVPTFAKNWSCRYLYVCTCLLLDCGGTKAEWLSAFLVC